MKNIRITMIMMLCLCSLTLMVGCSESKASQNQSANTGVDSSNSPSMLSDRLIELPPTKTNKYGFADDFIESNHLIVLYPKTSKEKFLLEAIPIKGDVKAEIDKAAVEDWILFESDDQERTLLILVNKHHLELFYFEKALRIPAVCHVEMNEGSFINYAKSVVYIKNEVMMISSEYPTSSTYEAIYVHIKNSTLKVLEIVSGDAVIEKMNDLKALIRDQKTDEALFIARKTTFTYPDRYVDEIIEINKLFFYHLTEQAKKISPTDPEKASEYYWDALQLVLVLEEEIEEQTLNLGYDFVLMLAESDPEMNEKLIANEKIADVLKTYIDLCQTLKKPISESLEYLSELLNQRLK